MSKSLGNVIDPMWMINGIPLQDMQATLRTGNLIEREILKASEGMAKEYKEGIPQCGSDALRYGLLAYTMQGRFINLDVKRVFGWRLFCNKIWNATKFALENFTPDFQPLPIETLKQHLEKGELKLFDHWILHKLSQHVKFISNC